LIRPFFRDNPDALEAFKKYGIANIQDLRVELMYTYVHHELIPKLLSRAEHSCLFNDNGDEECSSVDSAGDTAEAGASMPTTSESTDQQEVDISHPTGTVGTPKEVFLRMYGLRTLGITTIARWMYAVGFRFKKRGKHYFVDGHEGPEKLT
jgi:hypothetical protein